jgi:hypothetical protein
MKTCTTNKINECMTTQPPLQKILKGILHREVRHSQENARKNKPHRLPLLASKE